jgi:hypothetical protein
VPRVLAMASQPMEDCDWSIEKKNEKKWVFVTNEAIKNKTVFNVTLEFDDINKNKQSLSVVASQKLLREFHGCIDPDDDDKIREHTDFYYLVKYDTEDRISKKKAKGEVAKVKNLNMKAFPVSIFHMIYILFNTLFCCFYRHVPWNSES